MIVGLGIDLVSIRRIRGVWDRHGQRFAERILTEEELRQFGQSSRCPERFLAKRFAAKEAFSKALGTGMRGPVQWQAVGTGHDAWGAPQLVLDAALQPMLTARQVSRLWLTLTDEQDHAMACVVLESS